MNKIKNILIFLFLCTSISNASPQDEADRILDREQKKIEQERQKEEQEKRQKEIENNRFFEPVDEIKPFNEENTTTFLLKELKIIDKDKLLSSGDIFKLKSKYRYSEIGIKELNELLNEANARLIKKGYITSRINVNTDKIEN